MSTRIWRRRTGPEKTSSGHPDANNRHDSIEKRQVIAFLLFTLSQVQKPTLGEPLYKKGVERAQTICGLHEFTNASIHYVMALRTLEGRMVEAVPSRLIADGSSDSP